MNRAKHLEIDKQIFYPEGSSLTTECKNFNFVHQWLDTLDIYTSNWYRHWRDRHHIEAIIAQYGSFTAEYNVAYLHILCDWLYHFNMALVPKDKKEVEDNLKILQII